MAQSPNTKNKPTKKSRVGTQSKNSRTVLLCDTRRGMSVYGVFTPTRDGKTKVRLSFAFCRRGDNFSRKVALAIGQGRLRAKKSPFVFSFSRSGGPEAIEKKLRFAFSSLGPWAPDMNFERVMDSAPVKGNLPRDMWCLLVAKYVKNPGANIDNLHCLILDSLHLAKRDGAKRLVCNGPRI